MIEVVIFRCGQSHTLVDTLLSDANRGMVFANDGVCGMPLCPKMGNKGVGVAIEVVTTAACSLKSWGLRGTEDFFTHKYAELVQICKWKGTVGERVTLCGRPVFIFLCQLRM
jgi:hypothetical protein